MLGSVLKWRIEQDTDQQSHGVPGSLCWYPVVSRDGAIEFDGLTRTGTGPKLWAMWKAWRQAHRMAGQHDTVEHG